MSITQISILLVVVILGFFSEWSLRKKLRIKNKVFGYKTVNDFHKWGERVIIAMYFVGTIIVSTKEVQLFTFSNINYNFFYCAIYFRYLYGMEI